MLGMDLLENISSDVVPDVIGGFWSFCFDAWLVLFVEEDLKKFFILIGWTFGWDALRKLCRSSGEEAFHSWDVRLMKFCLDSKMSLLSTHFLLTYFSNVVLGELKYNAVAFFACAAIALSAINKIKISSLIFVSTENISVADAENMKY